MSWLRQNAVFLSCMVIFLSTGIVVGWFLAQHNLEKASLFFSPLVSNKTVEKPLQQYSIPNLSTTQFLASSISLETLIRREAEYDAYQFSYLSRGKRISGQLNIPKSVLSGQPARGSIVLLRGYVPLENYTTGVGTRNAAAVFAKAGYLTFAPDFLGYGTSDPELENSWEARFIKPVQVIELLRSIEQLQSTPLAISQTMSEDFKSDSLSVSPGKIGFWAHSNGGAVALTAIEIMNHSVPTTLWAPVTAPFPYSILYFGDELADEGKDQRAWLALFEKEYDVFDFSLTRHLDRLHGPLQLHQGGNDDAVLRWWSDEFVDKLKAENERRAHLERTAATESAEVRLKNNLSPISITYFVYPGADHNLQPEWSTVVARDLAFFSETLR